MTNPRISFCMTCMERIQHVRQTLPFALFHNPEPDVEVVLVDYNSGDGLHTWVDREMKLQIASGRLRYVHLGWPRRFHMSHAKNVAHRSATGDILINLDADNLATPDYTSVIRQTFGNGLELVQVDRRDKRVWGGGMGRIAVTRALFYRAGGYDEAMTGWGYEDVDFVLRVEALGGKAGWLEGNTVKFIRHDDRIRCVSLDRQISAKRNALISKSNLSRRLYTANRNREWGRGAT